MRRPSVKTNQRWPRSTPTSTINTCFCLPPDAPLLALKPIAILAHTFRVTQIPIAEPAAPSAHFTRGFVPWRLSDDGPGASRTASMGRRGGIALDGSRWVSRRPRYFLPVRIFSELFRGLMLAKLIAAHQAGQLQFFNQYAHLAERKAFARYLAPLRRRKWYVYSKHPFGGPEAVLAYLSRYTHRVAISNRRLIALDENGV